MKTIIELANDLADLRVMAARGQCVTSDEVADAYKSLEKAIAAARVQALKEVDRLLFAEKQFRAVDIVRALIGKEST